MAGLPGFAEIVHLHQSMVYSLAYHSLENRALAEELTQEVFLRFYVTQARFDSTSLIRPWLLGIAFWQAAIVAPISEEFGFRALLIGWFESIHFGTDKLMAFAFGANLDKRRESNDQTEVQSSAATIESSANLCDATVVSAVVLEYHPPWWPVLLSGAFFGLAHFNYGVSWVALIVFGVVLGRLYQLRQSIIPVIMVHVLFNAMNVTMLGLSLMLPANLK